ncbi:MAG: RIP metalloprotease RseP [Candidatus Omnitrophota bacterium]
MLSLIIFLGILGVLIIVHEFGHFIVAKKTGVRVEKFSLGFGPAILKKKAGDTEYAVNLIPLGGYVKLAGDNLEEYKGKPDDYLSKKPGRRAAIIFFGSFLNYILGILFFWIVFFVGYPNLTTKVGSLVDNMGAKEAGILTGDKIIAIDGEKVALWEEMQKVIHPKKDGSVVRISLLRADKELSLDARISAKEFNDILGKKRSIGLLGIAPGDEIVTVRHGIIEGFFLSVKKTWEITTLTYNGLWRMVTGKLSMRETMTGPIGIFIITSKVKGLGFIALMQLMALLSISLAIFNMLPFPALDGGHIALLAIEKIRGKYLSQKAEQVLNRIGYTLIICLALVVTYNDVIKFFGDRIYKFFNR